MRSENVSTFSKTSHTYKDAASKTVRHSSMRSGSPKYASLPVPVNSRREQE